MSWPAEYMNTDWRDRVIQTDGILKDMPQIQRTRLQAFGAPGLGTYIYQNRLDPSIKYALWVVRGPRCDESYLIVAKKNVFKLRRNAIRLNKEANKILHPPVLADGLLEEITQNTVGFLLKAKEIEKFGVKIKRGLILDGPPGNGKTMVCRYIQKLCSQHNFNWGIVTSADIDNAYEYKELNDLFRQYMVTFFDDIDVAYMDRKKGNGKMACSLLTAMDGMSDMGHLVRIFTTNEEVSELDSAFTRPGRIDKCITLTKPDADLRRRLVDNHWPEEIRKAIDVSTLIARSEDFSFAELETIRTFLVTNRLLGDGKWDLDRAFAEYDSRRAEKKRKGGGIGFGKK